MISLQAATASVNALKGLKGLQATEKNKHLFEKHISKADAIGAGGPTMSWFEETKQLKISSVAQVNRLPDNRLDKLATIMNVDRKDVKKSMQNFDPIVDDAYDMSVTDDVGLYGMMAIIQKSLKQPFRLYSNRGASENNTFRFICNIPAPYVGRRLVGNRKQKLAGGLVCMVIRTGGNAQVITLYPVPQAWPTNTTEALLT